MKRKIFIILILFIILLSAFIVYLNKVLLPVKIKAIIIQNIETTLNRKAELESLRFNILKGLELKGLTIYESPAFNNEPFLKIKEIDIGFLFLPILREKKVIITSLKIDSAQLKLIRDNDNLWNFSDLLNLKFPNDKLKQNFSFLIYKMSILKTKCLFEDRTFSPYFVREIEDFNFRANFSLPTKLKFLSEGKVPSQKLPVSFSAKTSAKGEFDFSTNGLESYLLIKNIMLSDYKPYFQNFPFTLNSGDIEAANLKITGEKNNFKIISNIITKNLNIKQDTYEFSGSPLIKINTQFGSDWVNNIDYSGEVNLNGSNINGIPYLLALHNLNGRIVFDNNEINFPSIKATTSGTPLSISGAIENLNNPLINLKISSDIEVTKLKEMFKNELKNIDLNIEGITHLELQLSGLLNEISGLAFKGKAKFSSLLATTSMLPEPIKNLSGEIDFDANGLKWNGLKGSFKETKYISNGRLNNFLAPSVEVDLESKLIFLSAKFKLENDLVSLDEAEGKFLNSNFRVFGEADISDKENPFCDLSLELNADLKDLKEIKPHFKDYLGKINPDGFIKLTGDFKGRIKDRQTWAADLRGKSLEASFAGIKLNNLSLNYLLQEIPGDNLNISADCYAGKIAVLGKVDLRGENLPFDLRLQVDNLDLAKLKLDTPFKDKPTSGIFSGVAVLSGLAQDNSSWQGRSSINFKDGNLWQLNLFKGLGKFLLIPEFEKIVFNEASGALSIANKNIHIDGLQLKSNEMIIDAEGNVGFSGNLNVKLLTQFSEQLIAGSDSLKKFITSVLTAAGQALTIKVTGTIQNPKYSVVPIVKDIIQNLPGIILENILK